MSRRVGCFVSWLVFSSLGIAQPVSPRAAIDRYCSTCHSDEIKAGGLSLNNLNPDDPGANPQVWEKVIRKLRVRYMPPEGATRPDARTYDSLIAHLESSLDRTAATPPARPRFYSPPGPETRN